MFSKVVKFTLLLVKFVIATFALMAPPHAAFAIDCQHATQMLDKVICSDDALKAADTKMAKAYFDLLKSTKDKEIHDLIIGSQRNWIEARYHQNIVDPQANPEPDPDEIDRQKSMLLDELKSLTQALTVRPSPVELTIKEERQFISKFSGGPFSGFRTGCFFTPKGFGDGAYVCLGTFAAQHNDRVCTTTQDWASGHLTEYRTVSKVVGGKTELIARCSFGYADTDASCPGEDSDQNDDQSVGWNFHIKPNDPDFDLEGQSGPSLKVDPDFPFDDIEQGWMDQCLTDPNYPPRSLESPNSRKQ